MKTPATSPLAELRTWLADTAARCRAQKWFGALFLTNVASDIVADVVKNEEAAARDAYSAEQSDLEAVRILDEAAADGLSNSDMAAVAKAVRLIRRSAQKDHAVSERLAA